MFIKNLIGQFFAGIFFRPFLELKVDFPSERRSIFNYIFLCFLADKPNQIKKGIHVIKVHDLLTTLVRIQRNFPVHWIDDNLREILVHVVWLFTHILYPVSRGRSSIWFHFKRWHVLPGCVHGIKAINC